MRYGSVGKFETAIVAGEEKKSQVGGSGGASWLNDKKFTEIFGLGVLERVVG